MQEHRRGGAAGIRRHQLDIGMDVEPPRGLGRPGGRRARADIGSDPLDVAGDGQRDLLRCRGCAGRARRDLGRGGLLQPLALGAIGHRHAGAGERDGGGPVLTVPGEGPSAPGGKIAGGVPVERLAIDGERCVRTRRGRRRISVDADPGGGGHRARGAQMPAGGRRSRRELCFLTR